MFEGTGTYLGVTFFLKVRNYRYQFLKYVRNYRYHLKKHAELWVSFCKSRSGGLCERSGQKSFLQLKLLNNAIKDVS